MEAKAISGCDTVDSCTDSGWSHSDAGPPTVRKVDTCICGHVVRQVDSVGGGGIDIQGQVFSTGQ